jgi:hypothetical protein
MRRSVAALVVAAVLGLGVLGTGRPAQAGAATDVALGLAAFAVFNQLVAPFVRPYPVHAYPRVVVYPVVQPAPVVYYQPPVIYQSAPVVYQSPAPQPTVVHYPHGRYELHVRGGQYVWVWIPTVPPPPPPPPSPAP